MSQNFIQTETPSVISPCNIETPKRATNAQTNLGNKTESTTYSSARLKKLINSQSKNLHVSKSLMDLDLGKK